MGAPAVVKLAKDWVGPGPTGDETPVGADLKGPVGMTGPDCGEQSLGPQGLPGMVPTTDVVPLEVDSVAVTEVKPEESVPTATSEEVTAELPDPDAVVTLDTPTSTPVEDLKTKTKKRRR